MFYTFEITTPVNTPATSKLCTILPLTQGIIHQVEFRFPPGPKALVHIQVNRAIHQLWPYNTGEDLATDDECIRFQEHYDMDQPPFQLEAYTWNESDRYPHLIIVRIGVLRAETIYRETEAMGLIRGIYRFIVGGA